jgi:hypothetical protein
MMRSHDWVLAFAFGLAPGFVEGVPTPTAEPASVVRLITQLGSSKFADREQATQALEELGTPALAALREAARSEDSEVSRRAEELIRRIERRAERDKILAPTRLRLAYTDMPLPDAVADLAKRSGCTIALRCKHEQTAQRKLTLDTGETTFWEALDQLCQQAGLVEAGVPNIPRAQPGQPSGAPAPRAAPLLLPVPRDAAVAGKGLIVLTEGEPLQLPTCYVGSVRVRIAPPHTRVLAPWRGDGQLRLLLEVSPEAKLDWVTVLEARVEQALDDQGQEWTPLTVTANTTGPAREDLAQVGLPALRVGGNHQVPLWLAAPAKESKVLKALHGTISSQVRVAPQPLLAVDNILHAAGQAVRGTEGGYLKVLEATPMEGGLVKLRVELQPPQDVIPGVGPQGLGAGGRLLPLPALPVQWGQRQGGVRLQVGPPAPVLPAPPVPARVQAVPAQAAFAGWSYLGLALLDDRGQAFQLAGVPHQQTRFNGVAVTREATLLFRPHQGQGEAARLVFAGSRHVTLDVPFVLKNVPLP